MTSRDLMREVEQAGWYLHRIRGSHHIFNHAERPGHVSIPHPKKDLGKGLIAAVRKQAGI
jgi:predicted RNA binding protein YcfA (HicA-like mRNA interferase family)